MPTILSACNYNYPNFSKGSDVCVYKFVLYSSTEQYAEIPLYGWIENNILLRYILSDETFSEIF